MLPITADASQQAACHHTVSNHRDKSEVSNLKIYPCIPGLPAHLCPFTKGLQTSNKADESVILGTNSFSQQIKHYQGCCSKTFTMALVLPSFGGVEHHCIYRTFQPFVLAFSDAPLVCQTKAIVIYWHTTVWRGEGKVHEVVTAHAKQSRQCLGDNVPFPWPKKNTDHAHHVCSSSVE